MSADSVTIAESGIPAGVQSTAAGPGHVADSRRCNRRRAWVIVALAATFIVLAALPFRTLIPPLVESDYCYLLIAAERMYDGHGLTSPQPVAPLQPWEWQYDWGFLTQWPVGYPLLVWLVRCLTGLGTIPACGWIGVAACALALVGWFVWVKRSVPSGIAGTLLAAVAAGCSVSVGLLINPSTDAILIAALPFILLITSQAVSACGPHPGGRSQSALIPPCQGGTQGGSRVCSETAICLDAHPRITLRLVLAGLLAGGLFWMRYASAFVPLAVLAYLLVERRFRRRLAWRHIGAFTAAATVPIAGLLVINRAFGEGPTQAQLNLGHRVGFHFTPGMVAEAWWNFTELGFYNYHRFSHWVFALWPIGLIAVALGVRPARQALRAFIATPRICLSLIVTAVLLAVLIGATTVFGDKFDYVGLNRYYQPIKPLYFLLFVTPMLLIPGRVVRVGMTVALVVACSWLVGQEWPRPYLRWLAANREAAPSGQWARCFTPDASALYEWLREQAGPDLILVSNFHEYIAFETGLPTLPVPEDVPILDRWITRIAAARGITEPHVLFVLDDDNKWRNYWIPEPSQIVRTFPLEPVTPPPNVTAQIYRYVPGPARLGAIDPTRDSE